MKCFFYKCKWFYFFMFFLFNRFFCNFISVDVSVGVFLRRCLYNLVCKDYYILFIFFKNCIV